MNFFKSEYTNNRDFRELLKMTATAFIVLAVVGFIAGLLSEKVAAGFVERFARQMADMNIMQDGHISAVALFSNNYTPTFLGMYLCA